MISVEFPADMTCVTKDQRICEEVSNTITKSMSFISTDEESTISGNEKYRMIQKGSLKIGENSYDANLYYNSRNGEMFEGLMTLNMSSLKSLKENLRIVVKGSNLRK